MKNHIKKNIEIVPANFTSVTPWIVSSSTSKMIDFLTTAFEADEIPHSRMYASVNPRIPAADLIRQSSPQA